MVTRRLPREPIHAGFEATTIVHFKPKPQFEKHLNVLQRAASRQGVSLSESDAAELSEAIDFFGLDVTYRRDQETYTNDYTYTINLANERFISNPADELGDTQDLIRELNKIGKLLSDHISTINDPVVRNADIAAVKVYLDANRLFFETGDNGFLPKEIPADLPGGLLAQLRKIDWSAFSAEARKWAETLVKILIKLRGWGI